MSVLTILCREESIVVAFVESYNDEMLVGMDAEKPRMPNKYDSFCVQLEISVAIVV